MAISLGKESIFEGLSYDDFAKPWQQYATQYEKMQDQIDKMGEAALLQYQISKKDGTTYERYTNYMNALNKAAEDFGTGMTLQNVKELMGLKREYQNTILPINAAVERRKQLSEEQKNAYLRDNTLRFEKHAPDISLDWIMNNPNEGYGKYISLNTIQSDASQLFNNLSKVANYNDSEVMKVDDLNQYLKYQIGLSLDDFIKAQEDGEDSTAMDKVISIITNGILTKYDINDISNFKEDAKNAVRLGLTSALGSEGLLSLNINNDGSGNGSRSEDDNRSESDESEQKLAVDPKPRRYTHDSNFSATYMTDDDVQSLQSSVEGTGFLKHMHGVNTGLRVHFTYDLPTKSIIATVTGKGNRMPEKLGQLFLYDSNGNPFDNSDLNSIEGMNQNEQKKDSGGNVTQELRFKNARQLWAEANPDKTNTVNNFDRYWSDTVDMHGQFRRYAWSETYDPTNIYELMKYAADHWENIVSGAEIIYFGGDKMSYHNESGGFFVIPNESKVYTVPKNNWNH